MAPTTWILFETVTSGLKSPVTVLEIAAQRMSGWDQDGTPFRRLLNHGVEILPEVSRSSGLTTEILERDGEPPQQAYDAFASYVSESPLVAYNLRYVLDEVLHPEWQCLGIAPIGSPGFCAMVLAQRLLDPLTAGNHKLETLRQYYKLPERSTHTALGIVETVADLLQQVLLPLANERGLATWDEISAFATTPWFPSSIAFGKYKGRSFLEALKDKELHAWLEWLAAASNPRTAEMGRWYLERLRNEAESPVTPSLIADKAPKEAPGLVVFRDPNLETYRQLIASARERLADLEADYTEEHQAVEVVRTQLFILLRSSYERRDQLGLRIKYLRRYLDTLLIEGEEEAETVSQAHAQAREASQQEYREAASAAQETKALDEDEQRELKGIYRKLVGLYHPDRYANDPEKQAIYVRLMQEINQARDCGDISRLKVIAADPNRFLVNQGLSTLDFGDEAELSNLQRLYASLQQRIISTLEELQQLRESSDYELYKLSRDNPDFMQKVADEQIKALDHEIAELEAEAALLRQEIENLTGTADPFHDEVQT